MAPRRTSSANDIFVDKPCSRPRLVSAATRAYTSLTHPWCFTPQLYTVRPDTIQALVDFVRSRPAQPVEAFERRSNAVIAHDAEDQLIRIKAPAQSAFGRQE
jgi:hypothetical protein